MDKLELCVKVIESYQKWGEWLVGLDVAAIGGVAFLYGFNDGASQAVPWVAKAVLVLFGVSILAASMLVGNLPSVLVRATCINTPDPIEVPKLNLLRGFWSPVHVASAVAGLSFTLGALLLVLTIMTAHELGVP